MKKKYLAPLLLLVLCIAGVLWLNTPRTALLDNDASLLEGPDTSSTVSIGDDDVPMAEVPPADDKEADPFAQFTEEEQAVLNEVLDLVNAARQDAGLSPLTLDPTLCGAAQVRAKECVDTFSHTRPNGTKYSTAIKEAGITATYTGENVATGYSTAELVVNAWLKSEGHRANILNEHYTTLGVGFSPNAANSRYQGYAWAQLFTNDFTKK